MLAAFVRSAIITDWQGSTFAGFVTGSVAFVQDLFSAGLGGMDCMQWIARSHVNSLEVHSDHA